MTNNEPIVYDKVSIEKTLLGICNLQISNGYVLWQEEDRAQRLSESILDAINRARDIGIGGCLILRLVIVTGDFSNEVMKWSKQLDETWRGTSEGAVGQTLTWGDGQVESTYAVVLLLQDIALGLVAEDKEAKAFALGLLIHELAHVHDNFIYLRLFGHEPVLQQGDWTSHRQFIARSLWGEFFAESYAYPYVKDFNFSESIAHCIAMLKDAIQQVNEETLAFQLHKNAGKVWAVAEHQLSSVFNHLGRSLALIIADKKVNENSHHLDKFLTEISLVSQEWEQVVRHLLDLLAISDLLLNPKTLDQIGEIVDNGFRSVGLEPYKENRTNKAG